MPKLGVLALVLLGWEVWTRTADVGSLPPPSQVAPALLDLVTSGAALGPVADTLLAWGAGLVLATALGVAGGLAVGLSPLLDRVTRFLVDFLRTIPALALVPLAVLLYGSGLGSTLLLVTFACTWPVLLQTAQGVRSVDPVARETCRSYRIGLRDRLLFLVVPGASGYLATGVRIAAAVSLLLSLSAEILIPAPGVGQEIVLAQLGGALPTMYAWIVLAGLLGVVINTVFTRVERSVLRWHPAHRAGR